VQLDGCNETHEIRGNHNRETKCYLLSLPEKKPGKVQVLGDTTLS